MTWIPGKMQSRPFRVRRKLYLKVLGNSNGTNGQATLTVHPGTLRAPSRTLQFLPGVAGPDAWAAYRRNRRLRRSCIPMVVREPAGTQSCLDRDHVARKR